MKKDQQAYLVMKKENVHVKKMSLVTSVIGQREDSMDFLSQRVTQLIQKTYFFYHLIRQCIISLECSCNEQGAVDETCADDTGKCNCKTNVVGDKCDQCAAGFFGFPDCARKIHLECCLLVHSFKMIYSKC